MVAFSASAWSHRALVTGAVLACVLLAGAACTGDDGAEDRPTDTATPVPATPSPTPRPVAQCADEEAAARMRVSMVRIESGDVQGTGIVVADDLVLTNAHVIGDRERIVIVNGDEASLGALYSLDLDADIALVSADTTGLEAVLWADTDRLQPGQRLLSFGFALGLEGEPTIATGLYSAVREDEGVPFVQTDAKVLPGASGGPLTNACGEVVGMNTLAGNELSFALEGEFLLRRVALFRVAPRIDEEPPQITVTRVEAVGGGCGPEFTITPTDVQIGRVYSTGDRLSVTIDYPANACDVVVARFSGYFLEGAPWYEHWCNSENRVFTCGNGRISGTFLEYNNGEWHTAPDGGTATLFANPGPFPPPNASTAPNLEGFHLCLIDVLFHDLRFGGDSVRFSIRDSKYPC